jgi:peptidoglycan/LPS O-acetylase OafA/YrhL
MVLGNIFLLNRDGIRRRDGTRRDGTRGHAAARKSSLSAWAALASLVCLSIFAGSWVSLVALPFGLLIYSLAGSRDFLSAFLSHPIMLLLGGASYSIYLLQLPVRDWVRVVTPRISMRLVPLSAPLTPVILIGLSILVFKCWEEPMRRSIRRRLAPVFP